MDSHLHTPSGTVSIEICSRIERLRSRTSSLHAGAFRVEKISTIKLERPPKGGLFSGCPESVQKNSAQTPRMTIPVERGLRRKGVPMPRNSSSEQKPQVLHLGADVQTSERASDQPVRKRRISRRIVLRPAGVDPDRPHEYVEIIWE